MNPNAQNKRDQAQQKLAEAARRRRELKQTLAAITEPPRVGDVFLFPGSALLPFRWAILLKHPDRPLFFSVPADTAPFVGSADVEVTPQGLGGAMVLRCAFGLWIEEKDFHLHARVAVLDRHYVERAQAKLEQVGQGHLEGTTGQLESDASPAYDSYLDEVTAAVDALREMSRDRRVTVSLKQTRTTVRLLETLSHTESADVGEPQFSMAAFPALEELLDGIPQKNIQGVELHYPCPGQVIVDAEEAMVVVRYLAAGAETPPALAEVRTDGHEVALVWKHTPDKRVYWVDIAWTEGRAVLRLGTGDEMREITVEP